MDLPATFANMLKAEKNEVSMFNTVSTDAPARISTRVHRTRLYFLENRTLDPFIDFLPSYVYQSAYFKVFF